MSWGRFWLAHFSIHPVFASEFPLIYPFQNTSKLLLFSSHLMKCSAVLHVPLCPVLWWNYHAGDGRFSQQIISNRLHSPRRKRILDVPPLHLHQSFSGSGMWMLLTNMVLQGTYKHQLNSPITWLLSVFWWSFLWTVEDGSLFVCA